MGKKETQKQKVHKILKRCRHTHTGNTWAGYLTPTDILTLIEAGYRPTDTRGWDESRAREDQAAGIGKPTWFYFVRNRTKGVWQ